MEKDNSNKITEALLKMSEKKPKKRKSTTNIIQQNKTKIKHLRKMGYSYVDISSFLNDQGIKINANQIGKAIRDLQDKKTKPINKKTENITTKKIQKKENINTRHVTTDQDEDIFKKVTPTPS